VDFLLVDFGGDFIDCVDKNFTECIDTLIIDFVLFYQCEQSSCQGPVSLECSEEFDNIFFFGHWEREKG